MKPNLLLFTNGFEGTWPSIEYGAWMAQNMHTHLTLTGVVEEHDADHPVEELFSRAVSLFQGQGIDYTLKLTQGHAEDTIIHSAQANEGQILVFGPFGRPQIRRFLTGRSFRHIMAGVSVPILYVPAARVPIRRVLICLGGLGYTVTAEQLGVKVAGMTGSPVTLLMVVPPIDLDYPEARKIRENWQHLEDTDTLSGRKLREGLQIAQAAGLKTNIKVRQGNVVEEILAETKEGDYDLICMGSQYSGHSLRHLYTPNVTADVAEAIHIPILTVRFLEA